MDLGLTGKVALVTGSSRGIGRGIATRLLEEGVDVVFCAPRRGGARRGGHGASVALGGPTAIVADVTTPEGAVAVVDGAVQVFGGLDIVVNNVGGSGARTIDDLDVADLDDVLGRNLVPALAVSRAALPELRERGGGVIALIASIWGREGGGSPSYNVAKAAEISLAKAMASDLAKDGIRVFSVAPGSTLFPGGELGAARAGRSRGDGRLRRARASVGPVRHRRRGRRRRRVPRLAAGSWVVGSCVVVDGGRRARSDAATCRASVRQCSSAGDWTMVSDESPERSTKNAPGW